MKRVSKKCELSLDAISDKPHITRAYGKWVCLLPPLYLSVDLNLCIKSRKFARELNRKRHKTYTHK